MKLGWGCGGVDDLLERKVVVLVIQTRLTLAPQPVIGRPSCESGVSDLLPRRHALKLIVLILPPGMDTRALSDFLLYKTTTLF